MGVAEVRYRYRLRVNEDQAAALQAVFDADRFVWNQALGRWSVLWRHEALSLSYGDMAAELTDWRGRYDWLAAQPQCPQQQVLRALYRAIKAYFDKANPAGRPRFKKRRDGYSTAEWTRNGFKVSRSGLGRDDDRLEVAVAGGRVALRVVWSRPLPSASSSVTVYRDRAGRWWASFVCGVQLPDVAVGAGGRATGLDVCGVQLPDVAVGAGGRATGLDVGLATFATTEDPATDVPNPRFARAAAKALARSQRNLARKTKGSKGRAQARQAKARVEAKVANQRADFHHKAARTLVGAYDRIGVEKLRVKNMSAKGKGRAKTGLNRSIADAGWAQFRAVLTWQATKAGTTVVALAARDSTQRCSSCGAKAKPRIDLSDRMFNCSCCGLVLGRDRNAARNLNPDRPGPGGRTEPPGTVPVGDDGHKTKISAGILAA